MGKEFIKRSNYVIDKNFQFKFIATFLAIIVAALVLFSAMFTVYYWVRYMAGDNIFKEFVVIHKEVYDRDDNGEIKLDAKNNRVTKSEELAPQNRVELVLPPLLLNNLIIMVLITIIGLFYSHKIAGPIYRIETDIARVLGGEQGVRIRLRKGDKLMSLADNVNKLIDRLEAAEK